MSTTNQPATITTATGQSGTHNQSNTSDISGTSSASSHDSLVASRGARRSADVEVPLGAIARIIRVSPAPAQHVRLQCKDLRRVDFAFDCSAGWVDTFVRQLQRLAHPRDQTRLFAFSYKGEASGVDAADADVTLPDSGWQLYDAVADYTRLGLANHSAYRLVSLNSDFSLCASYPRHLVVPSGISDAEIRTIASYRSQGRMPAVVYLHPITGASMSRCAQPLVGLKGKRSGVDEKLLERLRAVNPTNPHALCILDARPYKAAVGNSVMGKGYENVLHYPHCFLEFCKIDNIHAIRGALERLCDLLDERRGSAGADDATWLARFEATQWLHYVRLVLNASVRMAILMSDEGCSVVTHCSDGWDRTSQLCALTELMLDPHYRTFEGFAQLIDKEWLSFGHQFAVRTGHASDDYAHDQRAPIFLQFLDCVFQILRQFPSAFEFSSAYLVALYDEVCACRFGTFLFDCVRERDAQRLQQRTRSLWTHLLAPPQRARFANPHYRPCPVAAASARAAEAAASKGRPPSAVVMDVCIPSASMRRLALWEDMFCRWESSYTGTNLAGGTGATAAAPVAAATGTERTVAESQAGAGARGNGSSSARISNISGSPSEQRGTHFAADLIAAIRTS